MSSEITGCRTSRGTSPGTLPSFPFFLLLFLSFFDVAGWVPGVRESHPPGHAADLSRKPPWLTQEKEV